MKDVLFSTVILVSFLGGMVALLAPCCVSVMLPAYFASSFKNRTHLVAMTLVFALGLATVILPIGLGAHALSGLIASHHTTVFSIGGIAMIVGGVAMLAGWKFMIPMPGLRGRRGNGVTSVYSLGAFSGVASSCCAPVLAGVVGLSGATGSFFSAFAVGVAYVFGMVAPLAVVALIWDLHDWGNSTLLTGRRIRLPITRGNREVPLSSLLSSAVLIAMGILTVVLAIRGPSMSTNGWQVRFTAWLNHGQTQIEHQLQWLPGWASAAIVGAALAGLVWFATRHSHTRPPPASGLNAPSEAASASDDFAPTSKEH